MSIGPNVVSLPTVTAFPPSSVDDLPRTPTDIATSARIFGATCGPFALAAVLGTFACEVMRFFPYFPQRTHTTAVDMEYALECCGARYSRVTARLPETGVALLQLTGPWTDHPGAARHAQTMTHWIATRAEFIFDVNVGDWLERDEWIANAANTWVDFVPKATGWRPLVAFALTPQPFQFSPFGRVPARA